MTEIVVRWLRVVRKNLILQLYAYSLYQAMLWICAGAFLHSPKQLLLAADSDSGFDLALQTFNFLL